MSMDQKTKRRISEIAFIVLVSFMISMISEIFLVNRSYWGLPISNRVIEVLSDHSEIASTSSTSTEDDYTINIDAKKI